MGLGRTWGASFIRVSGPSLYLCVLLVPLCHSRDFSSSSREKSPCFIPVVPGTTHVPGRQYSVVLILVYKIDDYYKL